MAKDKKELDDDLLTGGKTLSSDADNKKAEKKKQAAAKKAEKNAAKLAAKKEKLLKEIEAVKAPLPQRATPRRKKKSSKSSRHCKASWLHWAAKRPPCRWLSAPRRSRPL